MTTKTTKAEFPVIKSLGLMTSYRDKNLLEYSLVQTIQQRFPKSNQRLFVFEGKTDIFEAVLVAEQLCELLNDDLLQNPSLALLQSLIEGSARSQSTSPIKTNNNKNSHYCFPIFNEERTVQALLLSTTLASDSLDENLINGILKVYSNYINLLSNTQRDKLTGLYNRETLDDQIHSALGTGIKDQNITDPLDHTHKPIQIQLKKSPQVEASDSVKEAERRDINSGEIFLGVVDIDHFKSINDRFGHLYGDEILILVARCMKELFTRSEDLIYRYGGEEFIILLHASDESQAINAFERLRANIQNHPFPQINEVTVSIGFEKIGSQTSPQEVISAADTALYFAKNNGRNRTEYYSELIRNGKIPSKYPIESKKITFF
ncbi:GGDEF domain-containing protein [Reinekea sp.]|jgi:diguanylate cyclase (GGDEF)-like protein|uniref:GGDEF domain-containing protein n=1 Tax=Reinekea sp. TaxID=1970455 RepID=UPI002A82EC15|nr:GGDEF domain-containing protein [Reinekea sp.]